MTFPNRFFPNYQRGLSLLELMVGIALGLLVVAVATGALMVSRSLSGTVSDASVLQQQGAYAMRTIGQQLRQAGSLHLQLFPATALAALDDSNAGNLLPVGLETRADPALESKLDDSWDPVVHTVNFQNGGPMVGFASYLEEITTGTGSPPQGRQLVNCIGITGDTVAHSNFFLEDNILKCGDGTNPAQPIIGNVATFQTRYLTQDKTTSQGIPQIAYAAPDTLTSSDFPKTQAIEICLELYGTEAIDLPQDATYPGCAGEVAYSTLTGKRAKRMHLTFRSIFQLRSQGQVGTVVAF